MGIHYDYKSTRGDKAMKKEAKRKARIEQRRAKRANNNPKDAEENTIRKLYGISIDKNSVHGSDSPINAKKEIEFFFKN